MTVGLVEAVILVVVGLASIAIPVLLLYLVVRAAVRSALGPRKRLEEELGVEVLRGRLSRGEITPAEFDEGKRLLGVR
jgi:uncharacterized membrane protein